MPKQNKREVNNLIGTSHLKPKKGITGGWKGHHEKHAKIVWNKCAAKSCGRPAKVGAHVEIATGKSHTTNRYIVPFCQRHNKWNTVKKGPLTCKPKTYLVGVGNGKVMVLH
jgi:hypothetical protein